MSARYDTLLEAFQTLLRASGRAGEAEFDETPARAALLWDKHLLRGERGSLIDALGEIIDDPDRTQPISMLDMGVHMVCPHHLTVAMGRAHVAYEPAGHIVGFGSLARLVEQATARLILQEEATDDIANTLVEVLGARAAVAAIDAVHPCHNVPEARSHGAHALTWSLVGDELRAKRLQEIILSGIKSG